MFTFIYIFITRAYAYTIITYLTFIKIIQINLLIKFFLETILKAKWKGLRDTFRAEIKKEQIYRKSKYPRNRPIWMHYRHLQFLKEQMVPRPPIWERSECPENSENNSSQNQTDNETKTAILPIIRKVSVERVKVTKNNHRESKVEIKKTNKLNKNTLATTTLQQTYEESAERATISTDSPINETDEQITVKQELIDDVVTESINYENSSTEDNETLRTISPVQVLMTGNSEACGELDPLEGNRLDDNYYFLMSLLPHIRTLPAERRMLLRMQMQELVYKEVYKKNTG